jgi:hypothetical protein
LPPRSGTRWRSSGDEKAGERASRDDVPTQKRSAVETAGKSSNSGGVGGTGGKAGQEIKGVNQRLWNSRRQVGARATLFLVFGVPEAFPV